ncbi:MAG: FAD-binding and (Fe-S)-binding domain-containing protein [Sumerlaeia bacterium]
MTVLESPTDRSSKAIPKTSPVHELVRRDLASAFLDDALVDVVSRGLYSTDASVYQFQPIGVVTPKSEEDVSAALKIANLHKVPVLPRGGGTSLAGQTANHAIVLDVSKHMNKVLEINESEKWVRVQPGLVRDELNAALAPYGLEFAPETSTSNRANVGGMIGNNSSGTRSIRYGRTLEHLLEARVMLPNGAVIECKPRTRSMIAELMEGDSEEGKIWRGLTALLEKNRTLIEERFPKVLRRVGGYSLDEFPEEANSWNLAKLICGSEGTFGVMLDCKLNLVKTPPVIMMLAIHFNHLIDGLKHVPTLLKHNPLSVELFDGEMIRLSRNNPSTIPLCDFVVNQPALILTVEVSGNSEAEALERLAEMEATIQAYGIGYASPRFETKAECDKLLDLRKKALGIALSVPGDTKPVSWIEDACVPVEHLSEYTRRVLEAAADLGLQTVMYGHASVGVLHIKPALNLKSQQHIDDMAKLSRTAMEICREYGGSWSGEHGDGVARGAQNDEFWGPEMMALFHSVKALFDPAYRMNPGRILDSPAVNENLRYGTAYNAPKLETYFNYRDFGGFGTAVEMCNGVGACRKTLNGTMCPSYMATRDEEDSTRGRANALRLAMSGQLGDEGVGGDRIHEVLDLCLQCKACKSECPSNVDMARMKAEHLGQYYKTHSPSLRDRIFSEAPTMGSMMSGPLAVFGNAGMAVTPIRRLMLSFLGIAPDRKLPPFATQKFSSWFAKNAGKSPAPQIRGEVALFADCWSNYHELDPAKWALRVLEALGYKVHLISDACCQRTRISKGFLDKAAREGEKTINKLLPFAEKNIPVLGIEPSCISGITDDLPDLLPGRIAQKAKAVAGALQPIEEFLAQQVESGALELPELKQPAKRYLVHGHCHQKALFSTGETKSLLKHADSSLEEVDSGCCGMAGSFGYEDEHFAISKQIGERKLLPAVRKESDSTVIIANGFSCRHQVKDFANKKAVHSIEAFGKALLGD